MRVCLKLGNLTYFCVRLSSGSKRGKIITSYNLDQLGYRLFRFCYVSQNAREKKVKDLFIQSSSGVLMVYFDTPNKLCGLEKQGLRDFEF